MGISKNELLIALVQFDIVWEDAFQNIQKIESLLNSLAEHPDIIVLPEAFNTAFSMRAEKVAELMDGSTVQWMKEKAVELNCAVCGSLFIKENDKFYNRFLWVEPDETIITYDKRHLFSMGDESENYSSGHNRVVIDYLGWRILPQICYDLRFPVWSRNNLGYDIYLNVASWPGPRRNVWQTLLKARAIENQCYTIGVNRTGSDEIPMAYTGDTMIVDPKGEVLDQAMAEEMVMIAKLSKSDLRKFRLKFDTLKDMDSFRIV